MNRQSRLMVLKRTPLGQIEGYSPKTRGNYVQCTHVNKGKKYGPAQASLMHRLAEAARKKLGMG